METQVYEITSWIIDKLDRKINKLRTARKEAKTLESKLTIVKDIKAWENYRSAFRKNVFNIEDAIAE